MIILFVFCMAGLEEKKLEEVVNSGSSDPRPPFSRSLVLLTNGFFFNLVAVVYYYLLGSHINIVQASATDGHRVSPSATDGHRWRDWRPLTAPARLTTTHEHRRPHRRFH